MSEMTATFRQVDGLLCAYLVLDVISRSQVRIDGNVFSVSVKAKHEFSASGITLDRKVQPFDYLLFVVRNTHTLRAT